MRFLGPLSTAFPVLVLVACGGNGEPSTRIDSSGGSTASGGASGGQGSGGAPASGGTADGGATGGSTTGGASAGSGGADDPQTGGTASGGSGDGGTSSGGSDASGGATGGMPSDGYDADCTREETEKHKAIVRDGITAVFIQGMGDQIDNYWADPYIQHNPAATSGVDTFKGFFGNVGPGFYSLTRLIGECDKVLIHGSYGNGGMFDMLRVDPEKERMVEHWDCSSGGLDGPTEVTDVELTAANRAVVIGFVTDVLIDGDPETADSYLAQDLVEHAAGGSDGADAFMQRVAGISYSTIHHQIADGNFVFTMSEGTEGSASYGYYDLFRVDGGVIVEHWGGRLGVQDGASGAGIF